MVSVPFQWRGHGLWTMNGRVFHVPTCIIPKTETVQQPLITMKVSTKSDLKSTKPSLVPGKGKRETIGATEGVKRQYHSSD